MKRAVGLAAAVTALAIGCTLSAPRPEESDESMRVARYVGAMTSTYYCACARWPSSFAELRSFTDRLQQGSYAADGAPAPRIPWARLSRSRISTSRDGEVVISVRLDGSN